jgi:hypothetical protein
MHKILNAISAAVLGLAMLLTSVVASQAAPVSPTTLQLSSNVEQVRDNRADWKRHHYKSRRDWRRDRHDWRRDRYHRRHWAERRDDRRWSHNRRYYRYGNGYMGGSGRSHQ